MEKKKAKKYIFFFNAPNKAFTKVLSGNTTCQALVNLIEELTKQYGHVYISNVVEYNEDTSNEV